jgi:hypothetical protein
VGQDLDAVAGGELVVERDDLPVDQRAARAVADVGVHAVREVDRGRAERQVEDVAAGREHVDLVLKDVGLERGDDVARVDDLLLPVHQLPEPVELGVGLLAGLAALLVGPVGGDAVLAEGVHLLGADLDLERAPAGPDDRGVQRLISVGLGLGDIVVELARDRRPQAVDNAEDGVTIGDRVDQHAHGADVVDLVEADPLAQHLLVDAVDVLGPAADLAGDLGLGELLLERGDRLLDQAGPLVAAATPGRPRSGGRCRAPARAARGPRAPT